MERMREKKNLILLFLWNNIPVVACTSIIALEKTTHVTALPFLNRYKRNTLYTFREKREPLCMLRECSSPHSSIVSYKLRLLFATVNRAYVQRRRVYTMHIHGRLHSV